jgi:glycerate kinase
MADGGDGSLDALAVLGWQTHELRVTGPLDNVHPAKYAISPNGKIAALELSELCGIKYLIGKRAPYEAHTRAIGEALKAISKDSWSELWLLLGGSASNDGGLGILQGLGIEVRDSKGRLVKSGLSGLTQVARIQEGAKTIIENVMKGRKVLLITDVSSPLLGAKGAIATFGRQKGLGRAGRLRGESAMRKWQRLVVENTQKDFSESNGAGAAGGVGFLALSFFNAHYQPGAATFLELIGAGASITDRSTVFTGEGRIDESSLSGKCVLPILDLVKANGAKAVLVCGSYDERVIEQLKREYPIAGLIALSNSGFSKSEQMARASEILEQELARNFSNVWPNS